MIKTFWKYFKPNMIKTFREYFKPKVIELFDFETAYKPPPGVNWYSPIWLMTVGLCFVTSPIWILYFAVVSLLIAIDLTKQEKKTQ